MRWATGQKMQHRGFKSPTCNLKRDVLKKKEAKLRLKTFDSVSGGVFQYLMDRSIFPDLEPFVCQKFKKSFF